MPIQRTGTAILVQALAASGNQSITVPHDCDGIVFFANWFDGNAALNEQHDIDGKPFERVSFQLSDSGMMGHSCSYMIAPPTGDVTFNWDWNDAQGDRNQGGGICLVFLKGTNQHNPIRDVQSDRAVSNAITDKIVKSIPTDYCVALQSKYNAVSDAGLERGQTQFDINQIYNLHRYELIEKDQSGFGTQYLNGITSSYPAYDVVAIRAADEFDWQLRAILETQATAGGESASGTPSLTAIESAGTAEVIKGATGAASITEIEAAGSAVARKSANGAATLTPIEVAGTSIVANIANGAALMPAVSTAGTALVRKGASGSPSLAAISASGAASVVGAASGAADLTAIESAGMATVVRQPSGATILGAIEASGNASVGETKTANGSPSIPVIEAAGTALRRLQASDGSPTPGAATASGTAAITRNASGSASIEAIEASGNAVAGIKSSSGAAALSAVTAAGTAAITRNAAGAANLSAVVAAGVASVRNTSSGSASMPAVIAAGSAILARTASGAITLPSVSASGSCIVGGVPIFQATVMVGYVIETTIIAYDLTEQDFIGREES